MTLSTHDTRRCRAHNRSGQPCGLFPIHGGAVCQVHGGRAPQVKKAAADRLAEMVDPILTEMFRIATSGESEVVRVAAGKDLLDRAGYKPKERIESTGKQVIEIVYGDSTDGPRILETPALSTAADQA